MEVEKLDEEKSRGIQHGQNGILRRILFFQYFMASEENGNLRCSNAQVVVSEYVTPYKNKWKKRRFSSKRRSQSDLPTIWSCRTFFDLILIIIAALALYALFFKPQTFDSQFWFRNLRGELKINVFGQDKAVDAVLDLVFWAEDNNESSVLVLSGEVGVGKTFTSSIVSGTFPWQNQIAFTTTENVATLTLPAISTGWGLITFEDCSADTIIPTFAKVDEILEEAKINKVKLIIMVLYTHRNDHELETLLSVLPTSRQYHHIPYNPAERELVTECFIRELNKEGLTLTNAELQRLINDHLKFIPEVRGSPGCKSVHDKVIGYLSRIKIEGDTDVEFD